MSKDVSHNCVVNNGEHVTSRRGLLGRTAIYPGNRLTKSSASALLSNPVRADYTPRGQN